MPHSQGLNNPYSGPKKHNSSYWYLFLYRSILILSSHLRLGLPKGRFPARLPVKILKELLPSSIQATWPAHFNLLDLITLTILGKRYKLWSSSLWRLLHSPFSSLLGLSSYYQFLFYFIFSCWFHHVSSSYFCTSLNHVFKYHVSCTDGKISVRIKKDHL